MAILVPSVNHMATQKYRVNRDEKEDSIIIEKPILSFEFAHLYYEEILGNKYYLTYQGETKILTPVQCEELETFIAQVYNSYDYEVYAYDSTSFVYTGKKLRSVVNYSKEQCTLIRPESEVSKFQDGEWKRIFVCIDTNGDLYGYPSAIPTNYKLVLTKEEFQTYPERKSNETRWNFETSKWEDPRDIDKLKSTLKLEIRNLFESVRWKLWGKFVPGFDRAGWECQIRELALYDKDQSAPLPYIDAALLAEENAPTKQQFIDDLRQNVTAFAPIMGRIGGLQKNWLKKVDACVTTEELDALRSTFSEIEKIE